MKYDVIRKNVREIIVDIESNMFRVGTADFPYVTSMFTLGSAGFHFEPSVVSFYKFLNAVRCCKCFVSRPFS